MLDPYSGGTILRIGMVFRNGMQRIRPAVPGAELGHAAIWRDRKNTVNGSCNEKSS